MSNVPHRSPSKGSGLETTLRIGEAAFDVLVLSPGRFRSFDAVLDILAGRARQDHLTVLEADPRRYGADDYHSLLTDKHGLRSLVDSVGSAAAIPLATLGTPGAFRLTEPLLVGSPSSVRYVCSFASDPHVAQSVRESTPLRKSFSKFRHLWLDETSAREGKFIPLRLGGVSVRESEQEDWARFEAFEIGRVMGILHNTALMWIDAHKGQFGWDEGYREMAVLDLEPGSCCWLLYRALTAAQAATTLVPLLSNFDPPEFEAFVLNYLDKRGDAGMDVFNYIVYGDHTGWKRAFDCGDYDAVVNRIVAQRDEDPEQELASNLCSLLGMSYSRLGRHDEACAVYQETLARLDPADSEVSNLRFGLGRAYYRAGQPERAAAEFRETIRLEQLNQTFPIMLDDARSMLAKC